MPLVTEEDYRRLGEHLSVIDAPLRSFANAQGYTLYPSLSGGRYPNRHMAQEGVVWRSIHIRMATRQDGQRFDEFFPEIPYTVFGGAWIDDQPQRKRWHSAAFLHTHEVPFTLLVEQLPFYLAHFHDYLSRITPEQIYAHNFTTPLSR
jgi:hypothetical protein